MAESDTKEQDGVEKTKDALLFLILSNEGGSLSIFTQFFIATRSARWREVKERIANALVNIWGSA